MIWDWYKEHLGSYPAAPATAKWLQSCPTLCNPIDGSPPGSPVPGILQARTLEWVAISFSNAWKWKVQSLSHVWLLATPWTASHQAPPPMGFSRPEHWNGVPLPSLGFLPYLCLKKKKKKNRATKAVGHWASFFTSQNFSYFCKIKKEIRLGDFKTPLFYCL